MSDTPIPELISKIIVTRLEAITTTAGYLINVPSVTRIHRDAKDWSPTNLSLGLTQPTDSRTPELDHEGNPPAEAHSLAFHIHCFVRQDDSDPTPDQTTENLLVASVKKALTSSGSDWHTFGGNAFNADFGDVEAFLASDGSSAGATLPLFVQYRISETDPFTNRA